MKKIRAPIAEIQNTKPCGFCGSEEFLLFVDQYDCQFVHEADLHPMSLLEAVNSCQDTTLQIIRMDQSIWVGEDVSEDIAHAWLDMYTPEPFKAHTLPYFVSESEAWQQYLSDFHSTFGRIT